MIVVAERIFGVYFELLLSIWSHKQFVDAAESRPTAV